ncbi:MAG: DUF1634 domain-containing protein, partial [FCB group bacterium]|nr:DUF1634 domain-containing protein [FCB group bacterium]
MSQDKDSNLGASPEQLLYANILNKGMLAGMVILVVTFVLYLSGTMEPYVAVDQLQNYWHMNVTDYLQAINMPTGWGWLQMLGFGDVVNFIGIAF